MTAEIWSGEGEGRFFSQKMCCPKNLFHLPPNRLPSQNPLLGIQDWWIITSAFFFFPSERRERLKLSPFPVRPGGGEEDGQRGQLYRTRVWVHPHKGSFQETEIWQIELTKLDRLFRFLFFWFFIYWKIVQVGEFCPHFFFFPFFIPSASKYPACCPAERT